MEFHEIWCYTRVSLSSAFCWTWVTPHRGSVYISAHLPVYIHAVYLPFFLGHLLFCIHKCIPDKTSCISLPICFPVDLFPCLCPCPVFLDHALSYICQSPVIFFSRSLSEFCQPARRILGFQMLLFKHLFYIHLHSAAVEHTQNSHVVQCDF